MKYRFGFYLSFSLFLYILLTGSALANKTFDVSNLKCKGGWVRQGVDKFQVISSCGSPLDSEVTSGADDIKIERLFYTVKRKNYVVKVRNGSVTNISYLSN